MNNKNIISENETMNAYKKKVLTLKPTTTYFHRLLMQTEAVTKFLKTDILVFKENCVNRVFIEGYSNHKIGIMNFASPIVAGGGFLNGASAQEEAICRASYLYPELANCQQYYKINRAIDFTSHTCGLIYSENIKFVKAEIEGEERFVKPVFADVITVAAPQNLSQNSTDMKIKRELNEKIVQTLRQFKVHQIEVLVLGAFGCGVFKNSPKLVAQLFQKNLESDEFKHYFKKIIFSTYLPNYTEFKPLMNANEEQNLELLKKNLIA